MDGSCVWFSVALFAAFVSSGNAVSNDDWLITNITTPARGAPPSHKEGESGPLTCSKDGANQSDFGAASNVTLDESPEGIITLTNGLITRQFILSPAFGTVDYRSEVKSRSLLRAINDEAIVTIDHVKYGVGGLRLPNATHAYLNRTDLQFSSDPDTFQYVSYTTSPPTAPFHWEPGLRHSPTTSAWPPRGLRLSVTFVPPASAKAEHSGVVVTINYEMYVGAPILAKWVTVEFQNSSGKTPVLVNQVTTEFLATQKPYNELDNSQRPFPSSHTDTGPVSSWFWVQTNVAHGGSCHWDTDSKAAADFGDEQVLVCGTVTGSSFWLGELSEKGKIRQTVDTFRVLQLVVDTADRERMALSRHRMVRLLAPETQENPIFFHGTDHTPQGFKIAVEQMAAVGFEMFIYSFGTINIEDTDPELVTMVADQVAFAKNYDIEVGAYDLIVLSRGGLGPDRDGIGPDGKVTDNACFASEWYDYIYDTFFKFIDKAGVTMFETDGPYGGQTCSATNHTYHVGYDDSVFQQNRLQIEFYEELKLRNIFINTPDQYFYHGGNKDGMGYNEWQYNLPRWQDLSVSRAGMFDDTFHFIPTQGWMQVPLVQYHGGGEAAEFDPMSQHLLEYEWAMAQYFSYGVAACYRGPRLYDSVETLAIARKWVGFYKKYRDIITGDIVHIRRPDMQDYDAILHVNPFITNRGMAVVFNPTTTALNFTLSLPLYYTGISNKAIVMHEGGDPVTMELDRWYTISINRVMEAKTITWYLIHSGD